MLVVSIWEPSLAVAVSSFGHAPGYPAPPPPTPEQFEALDRVERDQATSAAEAGAQLVREQGGTAQPLPVNATTNIAETVLAIADEQDAAALVVGSRGLGR